MTRQSTPNLVDVLYDAIDSRLADVHTALPGKIVSYDITTNRAEVQPLLKRKYLDEDDTVELPIITDVPVKFPRMGQAQIRLPVAVGDTGELLFYERSIDIWKQKGGTIDPQDPRKFSIADATFYPGLNPLTNPVLQNAADGSIEIQNGFFYVEIGTDGLFKAEHVISGVSFEMSPAGTFTFSNGLSSTMTFGTDGSFEATNGLAKLQMTAAGKFAFTNGAIEFIDEVIKLLDETDKLATEASTHIHPSVMGPTGISTTAAAPIAVKVALAAIKVALTTIKA